MKTNITASTIKKMNYSDLQKLCTKKGIEFKGQPRQKLIDLLLTKLASLENEIPEADTVEQAEELNGAELPAKLAPKLKKKLVPKSKAKDKKKAVPEKKAKINKRETKSSKILALFLKGKKVSEISKELKAHPSFCYTVIKKHQKPNKK